MEVLRRETFNNFKKNPPINIYVSASQSPWNNSRFFFGSPVKIFWPLYIFLTIYLSIYFNYLSVLRIQIRIHWIHMFLGLLDPDPDPLVRGMDPDLDPDPYHYAKIVRKTLISTVL